MTRVHVRVQPGARVTRWVGWFGEMPKLAVAAPPVDGAANTAVGEALAVLLGVRPRQVRLVGGVAGRTKRFEVTGLTDAEVTARFRAVLGPPS